MMLQNVLSFYHLHFKPKVTLSFCHLKKNTLTELHSMDPWFHDYRDRAYMNCSKNDFVPAGTVINMDSYSEPQAFNCL